MARKNRHSVNMSSTKYQKSWFYKHAMLYHKTVFDEEAWDGHRDNMRHVSHLVRIVGFPLWPPVFFLTCFAAMVAGYNELVTSKQHESWGLSPLQVSSSPLPFVAAALIVLLGFRTSTCYTRFDEARKLWGMYVNRCRDICRMVLMWMQLPADADLLHHFLQYVKAFPYCVKEHLLHENTLRKELVTILDERDLNAVMESCHRPNFVLQVLSEILSKSNMPDIMKCFTSQNLTQLNDNVGNCERLFKTPIPLSYTYLTSQFLLIWHLILPFALWEQCHWILVPSIFFSAAALFCIDEVGVQIEEPFSILPLKIMCDGIRNDIGDLVYVQKTVGNLKSLQHITTF